MRAPLLWSLLALATLGPLALATTSPFLAGRAPIYLIGGFAGIAALSLLLIQPLLIAGLLPLTPRSARKVHHVLGAGLVTLTALHIAALYLTSPPDTLDALLLRSPTPFSLYGVMALIAVTLTALLATFRRRLPSRLWATAHTGLAVIIAISSVIHAVQIQSAMEAMSKYILCALVVAATVIAIIRIRILKPLAKRR